MPFSGCRLQQLAQQDWRLKDKKALDYKPVHLRKLVQKHRLERAQAVEEGQQQLAHEQHDGDGGRKQ